MARMIKDKEKAIGKVPGAAIFIGQKKVDEIEIKVIDYDSRQLHEQKIDEIKEALAFKDKNSITWINIYGLHEAPLIKSIGTSFDLHPLTIEDILNTGQRPKMEEYENYMVFILKMLSYDSDQSVVKSEQLSIVFGKNFLFTFQEIVGDVFEPVRNRIRKSRGRIRDCGTDYLAYALLDTIVDNYILIVSRLGEQIEELESQIISSPSPDLLAKIYHYKQEVNYLRKCVRPTKDFVLQLCRADSDLIDSSTNPFLKDLLDLTNQVVETIDSYREMLSDHLDVYNSGVNNKLNEIMKVLTIFSVVFIPLTFIAGIYGTNFEYLPELKYKYSYFIFWGVMVTTAMAMLYFFKRKKWI